MPPADPSRAQKLVEQLCSLEFLFVTGKGGVGKSSVAGVLALLAAERGRRVLVVYPGDSAPGLDLWGHLVHSTPTQTSPGIFAVSVNSEDSMREYAAEVLGSTKLAALLFHHRVARGLLTEIPGPSEWAILGRAWAYTPSGVRVRGRGERAFDLVIVDAPSSGDGSGMLRMPKVVMDLMPAKVLRRDAENCLKMLQDSTRSAVVFVTLAEEMSVTETEENIAVVRDELSMPLGPVIVNQVIQPSFGAEDALALGTAAPLVDPPEDASEPPSDQARTMRCLEVGRRVALRERLEERYLGRVNQWGLPSLFLSRLDEDLVGISGLRKLKMTLAPGR